MFDSTLRIGQQQLANSQVVDQPMIVVHHIDDVQRLAVVPMQADVVQHMLNRPMLPHADKVGRHQPSHGIGGVLQQ